MALSDAQFKNLLVFTNKLLFDSIFLELGAKDSKTEEEAKKMDELFKTHLDMLVTSLLHSKPKVPSNRADQNNEKELKYQKKK